MDEEEKYELENFVIKTNSNFAEGRKTLIALKKNRWFLKHLFFNDEKQHFCPQCGGATQISLTIRGVGLVVCKKCNQLVEKLYLIHKYNEKIFELTKK